MQLQFFKKLLDQLKKYRIDIFFVFAISFLVLFVVFKNYSFASFLSGWDNLMPELNFKENIARSLSASWQEYQGLGLLGGMAHAADLPRQVLLFLLSFFIPLSLIRYFFSFLMLFIGPLGVFFLVSKVFAREDNIIAKLAGFVASFFYLFNLAAVQYFFVPFEAFTTFYGFLPWFLLFTLSYLKSGLKKHLLLFVIISIVGSSAFYVQTMFVVYSIFLFVFGLEAVVRFRLEGLKRIFILGVVVFAVNSFWLLPVLFFTFKNAQIVSISHINSIATPETRLMNEAAGDWRDIIQLKGFWLNYYDFFLNGGFDYLYRDWIFWISKSEFFLASFVVFCISCLGIILNLFRKKGDFSLSLFILLFVSYLMLGRNNWPFGFVFHFLEEKVPLFGEIFRSAFTKWSVAFAFVLSLGLGLFLDFLSVLKIRLIKYFIGGVLAVTVLAASSFCVYPVFQGQLIAPKMRVNLPTEYFQAIDFFNNHTHGGRIANLPFSSFWGWMFTKWGYDGSGFLWYGVKNPILDRAFDVWSPYNETFYNEASNVLYKYNLVDLDKDGPCQGKKECEERKKAKEVIDEWNLRVVREFENVLSKYNVSYLLLDESILNAGGDEKLLFIPQIKDLISHSSGIKEAAKFGFLTIYEFSGTGSDPVQAPKEYVEVDANLTYSKYDPIYQKYGEYINYQEREGKITGYPFVNFDPRGDVKISLRKTIDGQNQLVFENNRMNAKVVLPVSEAIEEKFGEDQGFKEGYNCDLKKKGTAIKNRLAKGNFYAALDGGVSCDWFYYPQVSRSKAYVLRIKGENLKGRSLKIYLQNLRTGRMDLEELLPQGSFDSYFVIFPTEPDLSEADSQQLMPDIQPGYTLNVETRSFGRIASENIVEDITFIPIDIDWLYQITSLLGDAPQETKNNLQVTSYKKYGTWGYKVETLGGGVLKLSQGYDEGWIAFGFQPSDIRHQLQNFKRFDHLKINGWANGWVVRPSVSRSSAIGDQIGAESYTIAIIYWPQLLEWGGFVLGVFTFILLLVIKSRRR